MMKNKTFRLLITILTAAVVLFNTTYFIIDSFFYNINSLPTGEFLFSSMSPTGEYTLKMYSVYGGKTLGNAIRGEVVFIETGKIKNVYWQADEKTAMVSWFSDAIVTITTIMLILLIIIIMIGVTILAHQNYRSIRILK